LTETIIYAGWMTIILFGGIKATPYSRVRFYRRKGTSREPTSTPTLCRHHNLQDPDDEGGDPDV